jgi:hypothetical protein
MPSSPIEPPFDCDIFRCDQRAEWAMIGESGDVYLCAEHYETQTQQRTRPRWQRIGHAE